MAVHKGVGPYGAPITLDQAKKVMAAAEAKAKQNNWNVVISIVALGVVQRGRAVRETIAGASSFANATTSTA